VSGEGFRWHPSARLFDAQGRRVRPVAAGAGAVIAPRPAGAVIAPRPAGAALVQAMAAGVFRIGGAGPAPVAGFETLTSGSSGVPRRVARSAASWIASFAVNGERFGIGPAVVVGVPGGVEQSLALYAGIEALHLGADLHLLEGLRPDRQAAALAARRVAVLYASPAQLRPLVEAGQVWAELRLVVVGGSKLDPLLRARLAKVAPEARLREFYGAAETSFIALTDDDSPPESVGRAYPGVEIDIRAGGRIWVRSPYLFSGYAGGCAGGDPGAAVWDDGWLSVGEIGHLAGGHLYLAGREGRMVTVADQNVFPEAVEALLLAQPGVRQAAVLPRPDAARGVVLVAVLQGDAALEAAILRAVRADLGPLRAPKAVIWRQDWPLLPSGKTDLAALARAVT